MESKHRLSAHKLSSGASYQVRWEMAYYKCSGLFNSPPISKVTQQGYYVQKKH